jgi:GntR family transcriptional repressor for pyruvate dehydrogenase complex
MSASAGAVGNRGLRLVPGRRQRLGDQLYGQILQQIVSGRLREGERLPPEKSICEMFAVSRPIVREALMRLRVDGLLQARQGAGTFVIARPAARLTNLASSADVAGFLRCVEVRLPLEGTAARLAAQRRTPEQMARIAAAHTGFEAEAAAGAMTVAGDMGFHARIFEATGNELFTRLFDEIQDAMTGFMSLSLELTRTGSKERARRVLNEHTRIADAIRQQDPDAAEIAMKFHIGQARRRMVDGDADV